MLVARGSSPSLPAAQGAQGTGVLGALASVPCLVGTGVTSRERWFPLRWIEMRFVSWDNLLDLFL